MPQSLVKILVHIVFSTKHRRDVILPDYEDALYRYISGIVEGNNAKTDHCQWDNESFAFPYTLGKNKVSELIGDMKRDSSLWSKKKGLPDLYWQNGYGAFSIGQSQVPAVTRYIANQKIHHATVSYEEEFRELCRKYDVEFDERFCWD